MDHDAVFQSTCLLIILQLLGQQNQKLEILCRQLRQIFVAPSALRELKRRFEKFGLKLAEEKTKILKFGRFTETNRKKRGEGKPETFDFLGFTFYYDELKASVYPIFVITDDSIYSKTIPSLKAKLPIESTVSIFLI